MWIRLFSHKGPQVLIYQKINPHLLLSSSFRFPYYKIQKFMRGIFSHLILYPYFTLTLFTLIHTRHCWHGFPDVPCIAREDLHEILPSFISSLFLYGVEKRSETFRRLLLRRHPGKW